MTSTLFEKIADRQIPAWIVWEDETHIAFLTPFPNTPGLTVVCPKKSPGDYIFNVAQKDFVSLNAAAKKVANALEKALGVARVALVYEGTGVAHIHAKLYPMHGVLASETNVFGHHQEFYPEYLGYLTTVEGPRMDDTELDALRDKIKAAFEV